MTQNDKKLDPQLIMFLYETPQSTENVCELAMLCHGANVELPQGVLLSKLLPCPLSSTINNDLTTDYLILHSYKSTKQLYDIIR